MLLFIFVRYVNPHGLVNKWYGDELRDPCRVPKNYEVFIRGVRLRHRLSESLSYLQIAWFPSVKGTGQISSIILLIF